MTSSEDPNNDFDELDKALQSYLLIIGIIGIIIIIINLLI